MKFSRPRLLVFNCHEAWIYQLGLLDFPLDIVVGLKGRAIKGWDYAMRPAPPNSRFLQLQDAIAQPESYGCVITHNLTDLLDARPLNAPKLLVIHSTLDGMAAEQGTATPLDELRRTVAQFVSMAGVYAVAVTKLKGKSWGLKNDAVAVSANPADYPAFRGDNATGLRIANQISRKQKFLRWDFHESAFQGLPIKIVGRNEDMPGVEPARDWNDLKEIMSRCRFFIHTADERFEDGYNMATLEAMAAGLPVIGNKHPTSPIQHGVSGFLSDDPAELRSYALQLLQDRELAVRMGNEARTAVSRAFSPARFKQGMMQAIEAAQQLWQLHLGKTATGAGN